MRTINLFLKQNSFGALIPVSDRRQTNEGRAKGICVGLNDGFCACLLAQKIAFRNQEFFDYFLATQKVM